MRTRLRSKVTLLFVLSALLLTVPAVAALAQDTGTPPAPTIQSDKDDYAPGELVTLTGSGWQAGEPVNIRVNDDAGQTWSRNVDVTADASGNISDSFNLPDWFVATYSVTATGAQSGVATTSFTDGNVVVRAAAGSTALGVQFPSNSVQRWNNTTCNLSTAQINPFSFTTPSSGSGFSNSGVTANNSQSVKIQAPSPVTIGGTTYNFSSWSGTAGGDNLVVSSTGCISRTAPGSGTNDPAWQITANYTAAPTAAATTLNVDPASGTYGSTTDLKAKLTKSSDSTNVSGKRITFSLRGTSVCDNDGTTPKPDCPTTDANGVATLTGVSLSGIDAGGPTGTGYAGAVSASFAGDSGFSASNGSNNLTVGKATATVTLSNLTHTYDGTAKAASATTTPAGLNVKFAYSQGGNPVTNPTNVGSYDVVTTVDDPNYEGSKSGTLSISKATQSITGFGPIADKTYGDAPFDLSASGGDSGNPVTFTATGSCTVVGKTVSITEAGNCKVTASQLGNDNYFAAAPVEQSFTIAQAATTTTLTCDEGPFTYNGSAHTPCQATVTGFGLNAPVTVDYANNINAGTATAKASYAGDTNYKPSSSGQKTFTIGKANATIDVKGYTGVYDGNEHGATGTATGVNNENLSSLLDLGAKYTDVPGGTANWSFAGNGNYNSKSGSVQIDISKADATINVDGYTGTYDGNAHGATGSAKGVKDESLNSLLHLGNSFTDVPGGQANWSFDGNGNYNSKSGSVQIVINKATPTITWNNPAPIDYGTALSATQLNAAAKGVDGNSLAGNFAYTPNAGTVLLQGTRNLSVLFTPDSNNYDKTSKTVQIVVNPYPFNGFFQPVDNGMLNSAKAGSTIPVKFSLGGDKGLNIFLDNKVPTTQKITCDTSTPVDAIEELSTATNSGLKYDPVANQYIYNWKTATSYAGTCQRLTVTLADGSTAKTALFKFTK